MTTLRRNITSIREDMAADLGMDPVEHLLGRIKSEDSMREKCRRKGLPETPDSALIQIHDAIGIRVVCAFLDDIYTIRDRLLTLPRVQLVEEKDYIRHVKPNGYRSYHMILRLDGYFAEIQLRTISMDTWAALEHHLTYKKGEPGTLISCSVYTYQNGRDRILLYQSRQRVEESGLYCLRVPLPLIGTQFVHLEIGEEELLVRGIRYPRSLVEEITNYQLNLYDYLIENGQISPGGRP